jgi:8-amino-7-oxononanoate synthase
MSLPFLAAEVEALRDAGLLRHPHRVRGTGPRAVVDGREAVLLCSNNYLALADAPEPGRAAAKAALELGTGAGASRLISGDTDLHRDLEQRLASHVHLPAALLFPSGYHANLGVLAALAGPTDLIVSDRLNHASLIDGIRLSRATVVVTPHLDLEAVEQALRRHPVRRRAFVVTESLFSMDGDLAPLTELRAVCDRHGAALVVDEAHALGVLGPQGRGACVAAGVQPDVLIGTLGKAFGSAGAFVAGDSLLRDLLVSTCRTFVFTTAVPPTVVAAGGAALDLVAAADGRRAQLHAHATRVRAALGPRVSARAVGPILPILVGDEGTTMRISGALLEQGFFVQGIRPPTVAPGTSRLRLTVMATHAPADLDAAARAILELLP